MPRIYLSPPHMSPRERELLLDAFDSNWIAPLGPHVDAFEREVAACVGVGHAAALSSGTAALHLGLQLLGVGPGDRVFVSTFTFAASANVVRYLGAEPVFIDSDAATWTMDPEALNSALEQAARRGQLPKAVMPVDLYGQCADYDTLAAICEPYGVPILEDAAEALGASYGARRAGSLGRAAVLSFNGNKIITTSGGGMLLADDEALIVKARFLASQARDPAPHYEHTQLGYNYRLSNLLAAVGRGQLEQLEQRVRRRRDNFAYYESHLGQLPGLTMMPEAPYGRGNRWLSCMVVDAPRFGASRDAILQALAEADIEARPLWKPMHLQPLYRGAEYVGGSVAAELFARGLCLPSGSALTDDDLGRIVAIVTRLAAPV